MFKKTNKLNKLKLFKANNILITFLFLLYPLTVFSQPIPLTLTFVGDVYLSPSITNKVNAKGDKVIFKSIAPVLQNSDITFGNLECSLSKSGKVTKSLANLKARKDYVLYCPPPAVNSLKYLGFDILSLANNHTTDYGKQGLLNTLGILENANIKVVGAGKNIYLAKSLKVFNIKKVKVGFLAYSIILPLYSVAGDNWAGINPGRGGNKNYPDVYIKNIFKQDISKAKSLVNFLVVSIHWGTEHIYNLNTMQKSLGKFLIDCGADLIIGHHPHILQPVEKYKNKFIFYSLGNFIFEGKGGTARESVMVKVFLAGTKITKINLIPVYTTNGIPEIATGNLAAKILKTLKNLSAKLNTIVNVNKEVGEIY